MITCGRYSSEPCERGDFIWKETWYERYEKGVPIKMKHHKFRHSRDVNIFLWEGTECAVLQYIIKPNWLSHRVRRQSFTLAVRLFFFFFFKHAEVNRFEIFKPCAVECYLTALNQTFLYAKASSYLGVTCNKTIYKAQTEVELLKFLSNTICMHREIRAYLIGVEAI